jgi:hypothetical protein
LKDRTAAPTEAVVPFWFLSINKFMHPTTCQKRQ